MFIAVGGGGLIAGVAAYIKMMRPQVIIVGCQPEASPVMSKVRYHMSYLTLFIVLQFITVILGDLEVWTENALPLHFGRHLR